MCSMRYFKLCLVLGFFLVNECWGLSTGTSLEDEKSPSKEDSTTLSASYKKCNEYSKLSRPHIKFSSDLHGEVDQCTITVNSTISGDAQNGEVPHMALIGYKRNKEMEYICGGSLISETYVLTTAYCASEVAQNGNYFVRLGGLHLHNLTHYGETQLIQVAEAILHPKFVVGEVYNDISLLRLEAPAALSPYIRPICLYTGEPDTAKIPLVASGWGVDPKTQIRNEILRKVKLLETPYEVCKVPYELKKEYGRILKKGIDKANMICATHPLGNDSLCHGDGGGPLYIRTQETYCSYQLVGIIGFGGVCKKIQDIPTVFTRVAPYVPWIENIVCKQVMVSTAFLPFRVRRVDRVCGGALISDKFVLTSGTCAYVVHMIKDEGNVFVRLGEVQKIFGNDEETGNTTQVIKIVRIFLHPQFTAEKNNSPYNIGLLQLAKPAQFNNYVRPACLQTGEHLEVGSTLIVSDWNRGEENSHTLRASLSVVVPYNRNKPMEPSQKHDTLTPLCVNRAGGIRSEDDGGTIFQALSPLNCYFHLVGISRLDRCGTTKEPHKLLYTRLAPNIPWIEKIVWPREASLTRHPIT